ncbi:MAG: cache domain-containing protein [Bacteriovoracaceae bacterium]|nr:cache domain-containing protein [Bacteriovoracaceae bacterium]
MITKTQNKSNFFFRIFLPIFLTISLFVIATYFVFIPTFHEQLIVHKHEMMKELTHTAWSILDKYHKLESKKEMSLEDAQLKAKESIKALRYGVDGKDYYWLTDMTPKMIMHPYRTDLDGVNLDDYKDQNGKLLFVEFVKIVKAKGDGHVRYMWQARDNADLILPKISYVKGFAPWGWIIGTGIYINDIKVQTQRILNKILLVSFLIILILVVLTLFVFKNSLKIETDKQNAQTLLKKSEERYRTLVESATDGILMFLDNKLIYTNKVLQQMIGKDKIYTIFEIIPEMADHGHIENTLINFLNGEKVPKHFETSLLKADRQKLKVLISISIINFMNKPGHILTVKDLTKNENLLHKRNFHEEFTSLINVIDFGIFRISPDKNPVIEAANRYALKILEISDQDIMSTQFRDCFHQKSKIDSLLHVLHEKGQVKQFEIKKIDKDNNTLVLNITLTQVLDESGHVEHYDGAIFDNSKSATTMKHLQNEVNSLNSSRNILLGPVLPFIEKTPGEDNQETSREHISENTLVVDAITKMENRRIDSLAVIDQSNNICGKVNIWKLKALSYNSLDRFCLQIESAVHLNEIVNIKQSYPWFVKNLVESGVSPIIITSIISKLSDSILSKLIQLAIDELGNPPCNFSYIALGSQARAEQTLVTDQDNAIIFENCNTNENLLAKEYFSKLATKVSKWLHMSGYKYCASDVMAKNPKWCLSLHEWKENFSIWIDTANANDLMSVSIFFDFRTIYGEKSYSDNLFTHIQTTLNNKTIFFNNLVANTLSFKLPTDFWGHIQTQKGEEDGEGHRTFNIKRIMNPIVHFVRIYSLKHKMISLNTKQRIDEILQKEIFNSMEYDELNSTYNFLLKLKLEHQAKLISNNQTLNNNVEVMELNILERDLLEKSVQIVISLQKRLAMDFNIEA